MLTSKATNDGIIEITALPEKTNAKLLIIPTAPEIFLWILRWFLLIKIRKKFI